MNAGLEHSRSDLVFKPSDSRTILFSKCSIVFEIFLKAETDGPQKKVKYENAEVVYPAVKCLESFIQFFKHLNRNRCNVNFLASDCSNPHIVKR